MNASRRLSAQQITEGILLLIANAPSSTEASLRGLDNLALAVAARRNAVGAKSNDKQLRARIEADMRGNLDRADAFIGEARTALLAGDVARYQSKLKDARIEFLIALNKLKNPLAKKVDERNKRNAEQSPEGGTETAKTYARPDIDDLIRGCLQRGERPPVALWVEEYDGLSKSALYRRIARIKKE
jgi:hypothetical protein